MATHCSRYVLRLTCTDDARSPLWYPCESAVLQWLAQIAGRRHVSTRSNAYSDVVFLYVVGND